MFTIIYRKQIAHQHSSHRNVWPLQGAWLNPLYFFFSLSPPCKIWLLFLTPCAWAPTLRMGCVADYLET